MKKWIVLLTLLIGLMLGALSGYAMHRIQWSKSEISIAEIADPQWMMEDLSATPEEVPSPIVAETPPADIDHPPASTITPPIPNTNIGASEYTPGTCTETSYENPFVRLQYTLSDDMIMLTENEVRKMKQSSTDRLRSEQASNRQMIDEIALADNSFEMVVLHPPTASSLVIASAPLPAATMTERKYLTFLKNDMARLFTDLKTEHIIKRELHEQIFYALELRYESDHKEIHQLILAKKYKDIIFYIALSEQQSGGIEKLLGNFAALK